MANRKKIFTKTRTASSVFKQVGVSAALLFASSSVSALGLGGLEVQSNLDQPLNGTIQLRTSAGDDVRSIRARIAARDDFEKLGIDYPDYLENLSLVVEDDGSDKVLRIRSNGVIINEPFIHFLVRIEWSGGSFLREYTALIDPPVYAAEAPKVLAEPRAVGTDQSYQDGAGSDDGESGVDVEADEVASDETTQEDTIDEPADANEQPLIEDDFYENQDDAITDDDASSADVPEDGASYGPVESGESLSLIAQELQRQFPDLSIYSIMQVMFEENRSAFISNNINGLIQGAVLDIGDLNTIRAVDAQAAKDFFRAQLQEWDPSALVSSGDESINVGQDEYSFSADESDDLASADADTGDSFQVGASDAVDDFVSGDQGDNREGEVLAMREQMSDLQSSLASSEAEKVELKERISMLEGRIADLTRLVDIENADLAQVQDGLSEDAETEAEIDALLAGDTQESSAIDEFLTEGTDAVDDAAPELGDTADDVLAEFLDETTDETAQTSDDVLDEFSDDAGDVIDEGLDSVADTVDGIESGVDSVIDGVDDELADGGFVDGEIVDDGIIEETDLASTPVESSPSPVSQQQSQSFFDKAKSMVFDGGLWKVLAGVGGLLLAGIVFLFVRRRRADEEFEISMLSIESHSQSTNTSHSETQSASISTSVASVAETVPDKETSFLTVYSDSDAVVQADEVDPVAEADVYIAYGRDEQAEEVLLDGIESKPERVDIKHKLLTLYHKTENAEGFERVAEELYSQRDNLTPEIWQEVCAMGKELAPTNPLFELSVGDLNAAASSVAGVADAVDDSADGSAADLTEAGEADDLTDQAVIATEGETSALEEGSVHSVTFEDGRSEFSVLDEVEIDALDLDVSGVDGDLEGDVIEFNDSSLDGLSESDAGSNEQSALEIDVDDAADLVFDTESAGDADETTVGEVSDVSDLEIDPNYDESRTQYELAKVFVDLGDEDGARKILLELVADEENDSTVRDDAQKLLDSIKG